MAVKPCKECKAAVSSKAKKCPHCGVPNPTVSASVGCISTVLATFLILVLCGGGLIVVGGIFKTAGTAISKAAEERERADVERRATKHPLNETVHVGYMSYEVREVWRQQSGESITTERSIEGIGPYIFLRVAVRNNDDEARQIPPFKLIDADGAKYEEASEAWLVDGAFGVLESLNPRVTKEGIVVFVAPYGRGYDLELSGGFWSSDEIFVHVEDPSP